ncbi:MAG: lipid-A-disaccharide synthase [Planctomycetota bacterium]|jgi:lipid-A-disaccharide synthase
MTKKIYISTGEKSGEIHAASLCLELLKNKNISISGMGGSTLRNSGVNIFFDASELAVTGFTEVLKNILKFRSLLKKCCDYILSENFSAVVLVDYPGFNMQLAKMLKKKAPELKVFYYICPKFWAWNYRRVKKIKKYIDQVFCIFPFEPPMLEAEGITACFTGNPLLDQIDFTAEGELTGSIFGKNAIINGIFPGSRKSEIKRVLPNFLKAAELIKKSVPDAEFVIGTPEGFSREKLESISGCSTDGIKLLEGQSHDIMAGSTLVLAKSGTTTLETALFGTPMIAVYYTSKISAFIGRQLVRIKHYTLPNLLTYEFCSNPDERFLAVPELMQEDATPEKIAAKAIELLTDRELYEKTAGQLRGIRNILGEKGASLRCAEKLISLL